MEVITVSARSFKCFSKSFTRRISNYLEVICFKEKEFISFLLLSNTSRRNFVPIIIMFAFSTKSSFCAFAQQLVETTITYNKIKYT